MQEEVKESMQEQVSEEIPTSEEETPAVLEGKRKKKSALIPVLIVLFIIIVVLPVTILQPLRLKFVILVKTLWL